MTAVHHKLLRCCLLQSKPCSLTEAQISEEESMDGLPQLHESLAGLRGMLSEGLVAAVDDLRLSLGVLQAVRDIDHPCG